jgi:hypothetical protein
LQASIWRKLGRSEEARLWVQRSIEEAQAQRAPWFEMMALIDLCEHHGATADDRLSLQKLLEQLPEARDTVAVATARGLLSV